MGARSPGTVTLQASASAGLALAGVQFSLDGVNLGSLVTTVPYAVSWDTTLGTNGSHTITAVAQDSGGNKASASVTVTVTNGTSYFPPLGSAEQSLGNHRAGCLGLISP